MGAKITISSKLNSQNVVANTSNITVDVYINWDSGTYSTTGNCAVSMIVNGTKYSATSFTFNSGRTNSGSAKIKTVTVNVAHGSDGKKTVSYSASADTDVVSWTLTASGSKTLTAIPVAYTLTLSAGAGTTLTANRKSSPSGLTGAVASGAKIWAGDVIKFSASASAGYGNIAVKVNNAAYTIGSAYTVSTNTTAVSSAELQGSAYIGNQRYLCYIWTGSKFEQYVPYLYDGTAWKILA